VVLHRVRTVPEIDELHPDLKSLMGSVVHDRYRVDELLGRGGMGAVFKGYHLNLQRAVAIKVLHPEVGRDAGMTARFTREAQSVSRLDHPNCVRVSDFGTTDAGVRYLIMELLAGEELQASLGQPWAAARAIDVATQILDGLDHAHQRGVVHRDLSEN
jgi:serine/threonine protein kinase